MFPLFFDSSFVSDWKPHPWLRTAGETPQDLPQKWQMTMTIFIITECDNTFEIHCLVHKKIC